MEKYIVEKFIKTRIGEPLTALSLNKKLIVFGSISGYIGYMSYSTMEIKYLNEIFDELVRGLFLLNNDNAYCALGDYQGLIIKLSNLENPEIKLIPYTKRDHNSDICSNTLSFISKHQVALITANPTQNKDIEKRSEKNNVYVINYDTTEMIKFDPLNFSTFTVPFDFDGTKFVWLEYKEKGKKELVVYDLFQNKNLFSKEFDKSIQFISFCRLFNQYVIYVEENKNVKIIDILKNEIKLLYSHNQSIVALDLFISEEEVEKKDVILQIDETDKKDENNKENNPLFNNNEKVTIFSIDYNSNLIVFKNNTITHNVNILKLDSTPQHLKQQKYIFDMGYPYYIKSNGQKIAFTSDFGLLIVNIGANI